MDRRDCSRLVLNIDCIFIIQNSDIADREFEGALVDISESGFGIIADIKRYKNALNSVNVGDEIEFCIPDEFSLFGQEMDEVVTGRAKVLRKKVQDENMVFGCKFVGRCDELVQYVRDRKTSVFVDSLNM